VAIDLELAPLGPPVLHGDRGLSRKGPTPGNASFYYSYTRLRSAGTIVVDGAAHAVEGSSWLDREWSTSALEGDLVGWDWFGLQLDDGGELMFYRLRRADGSAAPASGGTLVGADRSVSPLSAADVDLQVRGTWSSPIDGTRYPAAWTLSLPAHGIVLQVEPLLAGQELDLAFRYWEGAVSVAGRGPGGAPLSGSGYVELTGYAEGQR
jgi:predicted secreted hydrolase